MVKVCVQVGTRPVDHGRTISTTQGGKGGTCMRRLNLLFVALVLWLSALPSAAMADSCVSDDSIVAADGFVVKRLFDTGGTDWLTLIDVAPAAGDYALPGGTEGVLFTTGVPDGGIGRIDRDGNFVDWLVTPGSTTFPRSAYIEYGYNGDLYACDTVDLNGVWRISPSGI